MPVTPEIRGAEQAIDNWIARRSYWYAPRDLLLNRILAYYRDEIEDFFIMAARDRRSRHTAIGAAEDRMRAGVFQALKWAMEFCQTDGRGRANLDAKSIHRLIKLGGLYETFVDVMTSAQKDAVAIELDQKRRLLVVHQGPNLTGFDDELVEHQRMTNPYHSQSSFVEDTDQLTTRWSAGDFRRLAHRLASSSQIQRCPSVWMDQREVFTRPTVLDFPDLVDDEAQQRVLEDLTMTAEMIIGPSGMRNKWRLVSMLDVPFVMVGSRRLSTSDAVIALNGPLGEDHMVRRALQVDVGQYSKVSGLREERMIDAIRPHLEAKGWQVTPHYILRDPKREVDLFSVRDNAKLVLSLKCLVRPMTPREVRLRNSEIICGIHHTADEVLPRLPGTTAFLITNGYRGDYTTWETALCRNVMIGTVQDIAEIAINPIAAINVLKSRIGFKQKPSQPLRPRGRFRLGGWNIELTV
jgi:hypothetical protein